MKASKNEVANLDFILFLICGFGNLHQFHCLSLRSPVSVSIASVVYHTVVYHWSVGRCVDWSMMVVMLGPVRPVRSVATVVVVASQGNRESDALVVVPSPLLVRLWHRQSHADQASKKNERNLHVCRECENLER